MLDLERNSFYSFSCSPQAEQAPSESIGPGTRPELTTRRPSNTGFFLKLMRVGFDQCLDLHFVKLLVPQNDHKKHCRENSNFINIKKFKLNELIAQFINKIWFSNWAKSYLGKRFCTQFFYCVTKVIIIITSIQEIRISPIWHFPSLNLYFFYLFEHNLSKVWKF